MSEFDLVIRGGTVVDGSGSAPRVADVAVSDGQVREVGRISGAGRQEIDADGAVVAPGFVDIHTHYDGQATWDQRLQPSCWHGVTTVVMGNCGVGFAPVAEGDQDRLIELMEGVEDIPGTALHEGLTWTWRSFPEYLDVLDKRAYDLDIAAQVPHAALRVRVMGERAAAHERATREEIEQMGRLAKEAVEAGAIGFSTSRTLSHKSVSGQLIPSYDADAEELVAIARAIGETGTGVLQIVSDFPDPEVEFGLMQDMVRESGRPLSFSLGQRHSVPEYYKEALARLTAANEAGLPMKAQVPVRPIGIMLGLQCTLHPFMLNPVWQRISDRPVAEQAARMSDPAFRSQLLAAQTSRVNPSLIGGQLIHRWHDMYELTDPPEYEPSPDRSIEALAAKQHCRPEELAYDLLIRSAGRGMIYLVMSGYAYGSLDVLHTMLTHEHTVPGLSDGGAHVGTICDGSFATTLLQHWVRDRSHDRLELPFVIQRQARDTARAVGLTDRGELRPGFKADINVIDIDELRLHQPEMHFDLPGGGRRFLQRVDGYKHTIVSGTETYRDGEPTGELPGRLARGKKIAPVA
jgi:N-acyl-D-aspartate/D-glutamate deacylase